MKPLHFGKKERIIAAICVVVLGAFILDKFFISDFNRRFIKLKNQMRLAEVELKERLAVQQVKEEIIADYEYCKPYFEVFKDEEIDIKATLLHEIENLVKDTGGSIVNLSPYNVTEKDGDYDKYKIDLRLEATVEQLFAFLNKMQESKLLLKFEKWSVNKKDEESSDLRIDGIVSVTVVK